MDWTLDGRGEDLKARLQNQNHWDKPRKERITTADRLDKYIEGIQLNNQTTSNILDERHPLTWMTDDDEFAEQIDTTPKYLEEEPKESHPTAVGKTGGYEDWFDEIEFNLQPPNYPAMEPLDEMEPDRAWNLKRSQRVRRNVTAARKGMCSLGKGSQGSLDRHKLDKEVRGRPREEER